MSLAKPVSSANRRCVKMKWCEVVRVDSPAFLINAHQHACRYETADDRPLARGYYLALWPAGTSLSFHGRELRYLGPFPTRMAACLLQTSALGLGIVKPEMEGHPAVSVTPPVSSRGHSPCPFVDLVFVPSGEQAAYQGA